jgi:hypothetical protein
MTRPRAGAALPSLTITLSPATPAPCQGMMPFAEGTRVPIVHEALGRNAARHRRTHPEKRKRSQMPVTKPPQPRGGPTFVHHFRDGSLLAVATPGAVVLWDTASCAVQRVLPLAAKRVSETL